MSVFVCLYLYWLLRCIQNTCASFSETNEYSSYRVTWLQVLDYRLRLRYNVGSGEQRLQLSFVNVSDGQWHTAAVDRVGQWVTLTLDTAEGREVNESLGDVEGHVELRISQRGLLAGGDVRFPSTNSAPLVSHDFDNGIY